MIIKKTPEQVDRMAEAGSIHARCMKMLIAAARPGVTTAQLDRSAERFITSHGATPSFKGYRGFPASICASSNEIVVHGIPNDAPLKRGDVLSIDLGVTYGGWVADAAVTLPIGSVGEHVQALLDATHQSLLDAVEQAVPGSHVGNISSAVQRRIEGEGLSVITNLVGHGIGRDMHEDPQVPNIGEPGRGPLLEEGVVLAIEPMVAAGSPEVVTDPDGWSVYTKDRSPTAHFEFTVAVTASGPRILTPWHE